MTTLSFQVLLGSMVLKREGIRIGVPPRNIRKNRLPCSVPAFPINNNQEIEKDFKITCGLLVSLDRIA